MENSMQFGGLYSLTLSLRLFRIFRLFGRSGLLGGLCLLGHSGLFILVLNVMFLIYM